QNRVSGRRQPAASNAFRPGGSEEAVHRSGSGLELLAWSDLESDREMNRRLRKSSRPPTSTRLRVVVLIDPSDTWGRGIIQGISAAVKHVLPWDLLIAPRDDQWRLRVPRSWKGDGVIAAIRDDKTADHVCALKLPTVNVSSWGRSR